MALLTLSMLVGCGKKGPLIYPDLLLPGPPQAVSLEQTGSHLRLAFDLPSKDRSGKALKEPVQSILVYRRVLDQQSCSSCLDTYQTVVRIDPKHPAPAQRQGEHITWIDQDVQPGGRLYQYRVKTLQPGSEAGAAIDTIPVALQEPPAPPALLARSVFGGIIALELSADAPHGTSVVGYRLYRSTGAETALQPLGLSYNGHYEDQSVQQGISYRYAARSVVRHTATGVLLESNLSPAVPAIARDVP